MSTCLRRGGRVGPTKRKHGAGSPLGSRRGAAGASGAILAAGPAGTRSGPTFTEREKRMRGRAKAALMVLAVVVVVLALASSSAVARPATHAETFAGMLAASGVTGERHVLGSAITGRGIF